jgi:hypothetical protein
VCLVYQTGLSGFDSSNSAVSFVKFQNRLFTPYRQHQETFSWAVPRLRLKPDGLAWHGLFHFHGVPSLISRGTSLTGLVPGRHSLLARYTYEVGWLNPDTGVGTRMIKPVKMIDFL